MPQEQVASYLQQGFRPESDEEGIERNTAETFHEQHGGLGGAIASGVAGGLSGLTLGGSDLALSALGAGRTLQHIEAEHPYAAGGGQIAGAILPTALTAGAAAPEEAAGIGARILAHSPAALAGKVGHGIAELGEGAGLAGRALAGTAGAAAEGGLFGGGQYLTETALQDKPLSAEGFVAGMGHGALFAAPIGGAGTLAEGVLQRAKSLFPRSEVSEAAAAGVKEQAASSIAQTVRDGDQMAAAAERKLSDVEAKDQMAQAGETATRRVFGAADPQALGDQVTGAVDRQQITQALEGYQQARQQFEDWIATEADPELERALAGLHPGDLQTPAEAVPVGEFGAPGARGIKSSEELERAAAGERSEPRFAGGTPQGDQPATAQLRRPAMGTPVEAGAIPAQEIVQRGMAGEGTAVGRRPGTPSGPAGVPPLGESAGEGTAVGKRATPPAESIEPQRQELRAALDRGYHVDSDGQPHLSVEAQEGVRRDIDGTLQQYGLHHRLGDADYSASVLIDHPEQTNEALRLTEGRHGELHQEVTDHPGLIVLAPEQAKLFAEHARLDAGGLRNLGREALAGDEAAQNKLWASHVVTHESLHGYGPNVEHELHRPAIEELTTEMAARRITGDMHGIPSAKASPLEAYGNLIDPIVTGIAKVTGKSEAEAYAALESASLKFKGLSGTMSPDHAIHYVAEQAARELGATDAQPIAQSIYKASKEMREHPPQVAERALHGEAGTATASGAGFGAIPDRAAIGAHETPHDDYLEHTVPAHATPLDDDAYGEWKADLRKRISRDEKETSLYYTGTASNSINKHLKAGGVFENELPVIRDLDSMVAKGAQDKPVQLYRGVRGRRAREAFDALSPGDRFMDGGYGSSSTEKDIAFGYGSIHLTIDVPAGYPAAPAPSSTGFEFEVLLRRGTQYDVISKAEQDGNLLLHVRVVPSELPELETFASGTKAPDVLPIQRIAKPATMAASDDLLGQLQGTASKLGAGEDLVAMGAPARAGYLSDKEARTAEAAEHFRGKALAARAERAGMGDAAAPWNEGFEPTGGGYEGSRMAAEERAAQAEHQAAVVGRRAGVGEARRGYRVAQAEPPVVAASAERVGDKTTAFDIADSGLRFNPSTRTYHGEPEVGQATMGRILAKHGLAEPVGGGAAAVHAEPDALAARILRNAKAAGNPTTEEAAARMPKVELPAEVTHEPPRPMTKQEIADQRQRFRTIAPERRAAKAIMRHNGKNADMGPSLARGAKAIGDMENASAKLADVLGTEAPSTAAQNAGAYRTAVGQQNERAAASSAKAAADLKGKVPPELGGTGATPDIGLGGKLADAGSALEVLRAIGAHVPAVSHIPVIGPVLGLWLKARAVMGILGRKGGSIGKSTEGVIAAKAAATRDRIVAATGAILNGASKAAGKATHLAGAAALLGGQLFPGGEKPKSDKPRDLYQARMDEIVRAQSPGAIDQAIAQRYPTSDPDLHDAVVAQVQRGISFLATKAPKQTVLPGVLPGDGTWQPSMAAIEEFGKYVHAVNDPVSVLEDLAKGHVYAEGAETLKAVYPQLYQYAQKELLQAAPEMAKTLPYPRRVMISILYGIPVDGTLNPSHAQYLQIPAPPAPAPKGPATSGSLRLGQQMMSPLDQRAAGA